MATANSTGNNNVKFFVTATQEIHTPRGGVVLPGEHVLINPAKLPEDGDMVVVGDRLVPWAAQQGVIGVAVQVNRTIR